MAQRVIDLKEKHADYKESLNIFHLDLIEMPTIHFISAPMKGASLGPLWFDCTATDNDF